MEKSKEFLKKAGYMSRISFKKTPVVTVKLVNEKEDIMQTDDGPVNGMKYLVEQNGEQKTFFTGSLSLIQQLSEFKEGDVVTVKCSSRRSAQGYRTVYKVAAGENEPDVPLEEVDVEVEPNPADIPF